MTGDFFVVGGTLRADAPSYVERPADGDLLRLALGGHLCYVLTTRQMGKSSLMNRTALRLQQQGAHTAIIDLTSIGTADIDAWYLSLLDDLEMQLDLPVDAERWWEEQDHLSQPKRFSKFVQKVVLDACAGPVVIFIDEVDSALNLAFSDDFFAVVRAIANRAAAETAVSRLSFVLLGVAAPHDLIKDQQRTPFNVGERIILEELDLRETREIFAPALPPPADKLLRRIFYWTGGHPYLTQKVGQAIARSEKLAMTAAEVDQVVAALFFTERALAEESNLRFVGARVTGSARRVQLLSLYRRIRRGRRVRHDEGSAEETELKLYGLVKTDRHGNLAVRNQIYAHVFDETWVRQQMPANRWRVVSLLLVVLVLLSLGVSWRLWRQSQQTEARLAHSYRDGFAAAQNPALRLDHLADMAALPGYEAEALALFAGLTAAEQAALFDGATADMQIQVEMVTAVVYDTLGTADVVEAAETTPVLRAMLDALNRLESPDDPALPVEIDSWLKARAAALTGDYEAARIEYSVALSLNEANPATRYERALVAVAAGDSDTAVADLQLLAADEAEQAKIQMLLLETPLLQAAIREGAADVLAGLVVLPTPTATSRPATTETAVAPAITPAATPLLSPTHNSTPVPTLQPATISTVIPLVSTPLTATARLPQGTIVFTCFVDGIDQICAINADGSGLRQLTAAGATSWYPSLAPDGQEIFFSSRQDGPFGLYRLPVSGGTPQPLLPAGTGDYAPELSPDGTQIVFVRAEGGNQNIWVADSDGSRPRPLTDVQGDALDPTWSPDGRQIAFARREEGATWYTLHIFDVATGAMRALETAVPFTGGRSDWSPDGRWIAFYAGEQGARNVYVVAADGSEVRQITVNGDNLAPAFSPDGDWLVFTSHRDGDNELYLVRLDGTGLTQLTFNDTADWQPRWGP